jgi:Domain of unknown function (DUF4258)
VPNELSPTKNIQLIGLTRSKANQPMPRNDIDRIREKIRLRQYDMSAHAMEEMAEDFLTILDVEEAVLTGRVIRVEKDDPRGTKYVVEGTALDQQTPVGVVGRFASTGRYLMITVYEVIELEG